jgi:hypothetical protein
MLSVLLSWPNEKGQKDNDDLQNITQTTKDRATRIPQTPRETSVTQEELAVPARHVTQMLIIENTEN